MTKNEHHGLRTWVEIDRNAIRHNYNTFRNLIPKQTKLLAVVKSNAYGHRLVDFAREMEVCGADFLGVDSITEALALRREGIKSRIVVLGYTLPELIGDAIREKISVSLSNFEQIPYFFEKRDTAAGPLSVHVKVDTGMHRQGFLPEERIKLLSVLKKYEGKIFVEGLFTHFASAKNPAFPHDTKKQIAEFEEWIAAFKQAGYSPIIHAAATAGTFLFPEAHYDMVRIGIGLYGLWPAKEVKEVCKRRYPLSPVLSWRTIVSEIKALPKGSKIGYDGTETLDRDSVVAVCPVGYWHGYPRALSAIGSVLVRGKRAKVLGRISMDMISIDLTGIPGAKAGDEVTLIGTDGKEEVGAEELAVLMDASHYELVTRINPLVKRLYS